ncbi:MAG: S-formylglutathione hydrolase [Gammaproteobacteria bacterium]|nr:S-formylglutathione hydrolase [Gammaproteobacteria bacterium]
MQQVSASKIFAGQQLQYQHSSAVLGCDMQFSIYLPPQAESAKVPVLYWLSGLTCTDQNFVTKAGAQRYAAEHGIAIVCPDTSPRGDDIPDDPDGNWDFGKGAGFYVDATQVPWSANYQMYSYVVEELPMLVNAGFAVEPERTAISGHSMGGHGALTIALKNPEKFKSVSAFAPIVSPSNCPWGEKALGNYIGDKISEWAEYDTCFLILDAAVEPESRLPVLVDQGTADNFLQEQLKTELLVEASAGANYPMSIRYQDGYDHSYYFIASFIGEHIQFHAGHLFDR